MASDLWTCIWMLPATDKSDRVPRVTPLRQSGAWGVEGKGPGRLGPSAKQHHSGVAMLLQTFDGSVTAHAVSV